MTEHILKNDEVSMYYRISGKGKPVILLHGFGADGYIWKEIVAMLDNKYQFIIPDIPGSGRSTRVDKPLTVEDMAGYVQMILEKEQISAATVIGHSMGGYITLAFAEKYPENLKSLGLFHSTAFADSDDKKATRQKNIDFIRKNGAARFLDEAIPNFFADRTKSSHPMVIKDLITRYANFSPDSLVRYTEAMIARPERVEILEKFTRPILFIAGEHDAIIPLEQVLKQCKIPDFAYIYVGAHSGHMGMLEEPGFCAKAIDEFLSYDEVD